MKSISGQMTNRIMAISAILISAASFYVAVLQTRATQQQVKAETWPYLQIDTGNYDEDSGNTLINYTLVNAGVGPARVESMQIFYQDQPMGGFYELARECCLEDLAIPAEESIIGSALIGTPTTSSASPKILPSENEVNLFRLLRTETNEVFWNRIDKLRFQLRAEACYCSVLDECWITNFSDQPQPVNSCRADREQDYRG